MRGWWDVDGRVGGRCSHGGGVVGGGGRERQGATPTLTSGPHCPPPTSYPSTLPSPPGLDRTMLERDSQLSQRDLARVAYVVARPRLYEGMSFYSRARLAACQGHGVGIWLSALPTPGLGRTAIPGAAKRLAVRLWLGVAPRPDPPPPRCGCGEDAHADGRYFLTFCHKSHSRRWELQNRILHLVGGALEQTAVWMGVELELQLDPKARASMLPDIRATRVATGAEVWGDVSVACPFAVREGARVTHSLL